MAALSNDEIVLIWTDQKEILESQHIGGHRRCLNLAECPLKHFDAAEDIEDIIMRQNIMKKLQGQIKSK